jgi:hypothetical protein
LLDLLFLPRGFQRLHHRLAVGHQSGLVVPCGGDGDEFLLSRSSFLRGIDHLVETLLFGVGRTEDEGVVAHVDVVVEQSRRLGVGARNDEGLRAHDVRLQPRGDQTVDVLLHRHEHFPGHMAAFFCPWLLIFEVNALMT